MLNISAATVGSVRAILTDCGDQFGPGGSLPGTNARRPLRRSRRLPAPFPAGDGCLRWCALGDGPAAGTNDGPQLASALTARVLRSTTCSSAATRSFNTIGTFSGPNDSVNDLNRVVLFFLLLADRSGGNDRVATARILQQEKYGLAGVNSRQRQSAPAGVPSIHTGSVLMTSSSNAELQAVPANSTSLCGGTRTALVATADNFPDALSASYAAGRIQAAILLVRPTVDALGSGAARSPGPRREDGPRSRWSRGRSRHGRRLPQGPEHLLHH